MFRDFFKRIFGEQPIVHGPEAKRSEDGLAEIFPIIKVGGPAHSEKGSFTHEGKEYEIPHSSLPASSQIGNLDLAVYFGNDNGEFYQLLTNSDLKTSMEETLQAAYRNLHRITNVSIGQVEFETDKCNIGILLETKGLASSYILSDHVWEYIFHYCRSTEIKFIIPSQDTFLFCAHEDKVGMMFFIGAAGKFFTHEPKPITKSIFLKRKGQPIETLGG